MARDADELPREGVNTQGLIDAMTERHGARSLDVMLANLPKLAMRIGAKPPAYIPNFNQQSPMPPVNFPPSDVPPKMATPPSAPPKSNELPDIPRNLHVPQAKMMPGANTEPGKPISNDDMMAFNKVVSESAAQRRMPPPINYPPQYPQQQPNTASCSVAKPSFFKDGLGNEYKTIGDKLYVLGWQDANVKVRLINENSGKEIPTTGRKFQIYGWHLVRRMDENDSKDHEDIIKSSAIDDISKFESEASVESEIRQFTESIKKPLPPNIAKGGIKEKAPTVTVTEQAENKKDGLTETTNNDTPVPEAKSTAKLDKSVAVSDEMKTSMAELKTKKRLI